MERHNSSRNPAPSAGESKNVTSTEKLLSGLSIGSNPHARRKSGSPGGYSAYREGESRLEEQDEEEPAKPFFDEQFKLALKGGVSLAGEIADTLVHCELAADTSSHLHLLWESATALCNYKSPNSRYWYSWRFW